MYKYTNPDNICVVLCSEPNPVDPALHVPSIGELVAEARRTGQMPYSSQRTPIPSYTDDIDSDISYDGIDKIGSVLNEQAFRSRIEDTESSLEDIKAEMDRLIQPEPKPESKPES